MKRLITANSSPINGPLSRNERVSGTTFALMNRLATCYARDAALPGRNPYDDWRLAWCFSV